MLTIFIQQFRNKFLFIDGIFVFLIRNIKICVNMSSLLTSDSVSYERAKELETLEIEANITSLLNPR